MINKFDNISYTHIKSFNYIPYSRTRYMFEAESKFTIEYRIKGERVFVRVPDCVRRQIEHESFTLIDTIRRLSRVQ